MLESLYPLSALGSHIQFEGRGFRQKDFKFLVDLLSTWRYSQQERAAAPSFHNTQVSRYFKNLLELGWVKQITRATQPRYRLTRAGIFGIVEGIRTQALSGSFEEFIFTNSLLQNYRVRILRMIESEGTALPLIQKQEIEKILDSKLLIQQRRAHAEASISYWELRIKETDSISKLVESQLKNKVPLNEIILEIERRYPYELKSTKPLSTLLFELPEDIQRWEITEGNKIRSTKIWKSYVNFLRLELESLKGMP